MSGRDWKSGQPGGQDVDRGKSLPGIPHRRCASAPGSLQPTPQPVGESGSAGQSAMAASEQSSATSSASRPSEASESTSGGDPSSAGSPREPEVSKASSPTAIRDWKGARPKTTRNPVLSTRERELSGEPGRRSGIVRGTGMVDLSSEMEMMHNPGRPLRMTRDRGRMGPLPAPKTSAVRKSSPAGSRASRSFEDSEEEMMHDPGRPLRMARDRGRMSPPPEASAVMESPPAGSRASKPFEDTEDTMSTFATKWESARPKTPRNPVKTAHQRQQRHESDRPQPISRDKGIYDRWSVASSGFESMVRSLETSEESTSVDDPSWGSGRSRLQRRFTESGRQSEGTRRYDMPLPITGDRSSVVPSKAVRFQIEAGPEFSSTRRPLVLNLSRLSAAEATATERRGHPIISSTKSSGPQTVAEWPSRSHSLLETADENTDWLSAESRESSSPSASSESMHRSFNPETELAELHAQGSRSHVPGFDPSADHGDDNQALIIRFSGPSCFNWESEYFTKINQSLTFNDDKTGKKVICNFILMLPDKFSEIVDILRQAFAKKEYVGIDPILFICRLMVEAVTPTKMTFSIEIHTPEMKDFAVKFARVLTSHFSRDLSELSFRELFHLDRLRLMPVDPDILMQRLSGLDQLKLATYFSRLMPYIGLINAGTNVSKFLAKLADALKDRDKVVLEFKLLSWQTSSPDTFNRGKRVLDALQTFVNEYRNDLQPKIEKMRELKLAALAYVRGEVHHQNSIWKKANWYEHIRSEHLIQASVVAVTIYRCAFLQPQTPAIELLDRDEMPIHF